MRKKIIILLLISMALYSIFLINSGKKAKAEECKKTIQVVTKTGNAEYPENWRCSCDPYMPMTLDVTYDSNYPGTIHCGSEIIINVNDGCAPFVGEITSGNGYTLTRDENEQRLFILSCSGNSCGDSDGQYSAVTTLKITDSCGNDVETSLRNKGGMWDEGTLVCGDPNAGAWVLCDNTQGGSKTEVTFSPGAHSGCSGYNCGNANPECSGTECCAAIEEVGGNCPNTECITIREDWYKCKIEGSGYVGANFKIKEHTWICR